MRNFFKCVVVLCMISMILVSMLGCNSAQTDTPTKSQSSSVVTQTQAPSAAASVTPSKQTSQTPQKVIEMRLATSVNPGNPMNNAAESFAAKVLKASDGRIKITVFPQRQLGDDVEVIEQMIAGAIDMVEVSGVIFANYSDLPNAWQLPFLFKDWDHYAKVMKSKQARAILDGLNDKGIQGLAVYTSFFRHICIADGKERTTFESFKGLKIRTAQSKMLLDAWAAMGLSPTPMAFGEVYTGLQNKVIDATETDAFGLVEDKFGEVCKYVAVTGHYNWPALLAINKAKFQSFSAEDQKMLIECAEAVIDENIAEVKGIDAKYQERAKNELKVKFSTIAESELVKFRQAVQPVVDKYAALDPRIKDFVDYAKSLQ